MFVTLIIYLDLFFIQSVSFDNRYIILSSKELYLAKTANHQIYRYDIQ